MKCNRCNNTINYGYTVCPYCGEYVNNNINNNVIKKDKKENNCNFINILVLSLFGLSFGLFYIAELMRSYTYYSEYYYLEDSILKLFAPIDALSYTIPHFIFVLVSIAPLFTKKRIINVILLIGALICSGIIFSVMNRVEIYNSGILYTISFAISIALSLILTVKLIFKK